MKKFIFVLTIPFLISSPLLAKEPFALPKTYQKVLKSLDIKEAMYKNDFLFVAFNREKSTEALLHSVVNSFCYETYLNKRFTIKDIHIQKVTVTNQNYSYSFHFNYDVAKYCKDIDKLDTEASNALFKKFVTEG